MESYKNSESGENKPTFTSQQTEKKLKIGVIILSILVIGFLIAMIVVIVVAIKYRKPEVCLTEGCIKAAAHLLENMDLSVDPCEDFVKFTCGKWMENNREGNGSTVLEKANERLTINLKKYIEEEKKERNKPTCVRKFYKAFEVCQNQGGIDNDTLNTLQRTLQTVGGWPIAERIWKEPPYDWGLLFSYSVQKLMSKHVISVTVETNPYDSSENVIHIQHLDPDESLPLELNVIKLMAIALSGKDIAAMEQDIQDLEWMDTYLRNISKPSMQLYFIEGEMELLTIQELNHLYPTVNWIQVFENICSPYLKSIGYRITLKDKVIIKGTSYLRQVLEKVKQGRITKRMLMNYLVARYIQNIGGHYLRETEEGIANHIKNKREVNHKSASEEKYEECFSLLCEIFPSVVDYIYGKYRRENLVDPKMIKYMFSAMDDMVTDAAWLDPKTKKEVKDKLNAMVPLTTFPPWTQDRNALETFYKDLPEMTNNALENRRIMLKFINTKTHQRLAEKNKRNDTFWWVAQQELRGSVVNAFYFLDYNFIVLAVGIQVYPYFVADRPTYMNFGGMGPIVGHEITHGLDKIGSTRDKFGNIRNLWTPESKKEFDKGAQCFIKQYSSYGFPGGLFVDGKRTLSENIADNGGIRQAYLAYQKWRKDYGEEKLLPGLEKYNANQLLFISFGGSRCSNPTGSFISAMIRGIHSPDNYRVIGSLSNLKEFSDVFSCKSGSAMNPAKKCSIW